MIDFTEFKQKLEMDKKYFIHTNELITEPEIAQIKELIVNQKY